MSISSSRNRVTRYGFTIPAVGVDDDDVPDSDVVHPDGENGKSKCMVAE